MEKTSSPKQKIARCFVDGRSNKHSVYRHSIVYGLCHLIFRYITAINLIQQLLLHVFWETSRSSRRKLRASLVAYRSKIRLYGCVLVPSGRQRLLVYTRDEPLLYRPTTSCRYSMLSRWCVMQPTPLSGLFLSSSRKNSHLASLGMSIFKDLQQIGFNKRILLLNRIPAKPPWMCYTVQSTFSTCWITANTIPVLMCYRPSQFLLKYDSLSETLSSYIQMAQGLEIELHLLWCQRHGRDLMLADKSSIIICC